MKIVASVSHGSIKATYEIPKDIVDWERVIEELKKDIYKHTLIVPPSEELIEVLLDTPLQFAKFSSWLGDTICKNW